MKSLSNTCSCGSNEEPNAQANSCLCVSGYKEGAGGNCVAIESSETCCVADSDCGGNEACYIDPTFLSNGNFSLPGKCLSPDDITHPAGYTQALPEKEADTPIVSNLCDNSYDQCCGEHALKLEKFVGGKKAEHDRLSIKKR